MLAFQMINKSKQSWAGHFGVAGAEMFQVCFVLELPSDSETQNSRHCFGVPSEFSNVSFSHGNSTKSYVSCCFVDMIVQVFVDKKTFHSDRISRSRQTQLISTHFTKMIRLHLDTDMYHC